MDRSGRELKHQAGDNPIVTATMMKQLSLLVVGAAVALVGFFVGGNVSSPEVTPSPSLGGSINTIRQFFGAGSEALFVSFGDKTLDVASGSKTFTAADVCENFLVNHDGDSFASTQPATWPSGTTLINKCLPEKGDHRFILYRNTSVDEVTTLTGGTNSPLKVASASSAGGNNGKVSAGNDAFLKFVNVDGTNVNIYVSEFDDD